MSEPISALNGAVYNQGIAEVTALDPIGMISIRGDLAAGYLKKPLKKITGVAMPDMRGINLDGGTGVAWMSPDELLLICPYADVATNLETLHKAIGTNHALAVNVSDARAVFRVTGKHTREVLAKLAPVDTSPEAFTPGTIRRTRLAQVPAAFWMVDTDTAELVCFRSVAQYVFDLLKTAAQPGSQVNYHRG
ncbi:sarcosine oxidase subunit gamma [Sulfitobacter sp. CW3]|uniref:sarcosine oxidase subunit gamma n=1 Tax=Sulfitobacter sp. CW3 TaxID=2861965 RepID=UPI001C5F383E|nr:sarcosine oxidase subunit gamma family protein [Sulfitobacter sp. CW3]MBW4963980.1 sarcosine oxidase subunit gamma [Sulfitobacter sp. CW3]